MRSGIAGVVRRAVWPLLVAGLTTLSPIFALAQSTDVLRLAVREASLVWDSPARNRLYVNVSFRDAISDGIRDKLKRGLPTTIVLAATLHSPNRDKALATTAQSCKVTWHVWEEAYRLEIVRPGERRPITWSPTVEGVVRRCGEAARLLAATREQIPSDEALYLEASVLVNPVSQDVLAKIKRWVSRPSGTGTAAPGDALFSTFTGLFLQRIGRAESMFAFTTRATLPQIPR